MDAALKPPPPDEHAADEASSPADRKVLVVDDFSDAREMYAEYFQFLGYQVETATNGLEAIERAQDFHPDVILMDMSLPVMSGWEATRRLKDDERTRDIPVMAVTGHVFAASSERAEQSGCDAFVPKPALPDTLEGQVRALLKKAGSKPKLR